MLRTQNHLSNQIAVHWKCSPWKLHINNLTSWYHSLFFSFFFRKCKSLVSCCYYSLDFHCQHFLYSVSSIWTVNSPVPTACHLCFLFFLCNPCRCRDLLFHKTTSILSLSSVQIIHLPQFSMKAHFSVSPQGPSRTWSMTSGAWFGRRTATASWWSPNWWRWGEWVE